MLLNGLGVVKRSQDGVVNDRPRRHPWMDVENEFNDMLASDPLAELNSYLNAKLYLKKLDYKGFAFQSNSPIVIPALQASHIQCRNDKYQLLISR